MRSLILWFNEAAWNPARGSGKEKILELPELVESESWIHKSGGHQKTLIDEAGKYW